MEHGEDTAQILKAIRQAADQAVRDIGAHQYLCRTLEPPVFLSPGRGWPANDETVAYVVDHLMRLPAGWSLLELGSGLSTAWFGLAALRTGGTVFSVEHDADYLERTRELVERVRAQDVVTLVHAPLTRLDRFDSEWYHLDSIPSGSPVDILFVDGPPGALGRHVRRPAFRLLKDRLRDGATVVLDDTVRSAEREVLALWVDEDAGDDTLRVTDRLGRSTAAGFGRAPRS